MVFKEVLLEAFQDMEGSEGVFKEGCSHLNGRSPGQEKLNGIGSVHDSTQSDNGDGDGMGDLPYHSEGDGFDGRS